MIRVAFPIVGGPSSWTGGITYLINLLQVINEYAAHIIEPYVVATDAADQDALKMLSPYLRTELIRIPSRGGKVRATWRLMQSLLLQRDVATERVLLDAGVDVVFQHSAWYGFRFRVPTLAWIADFQHRYLPSMFSGRNYLKREVGYRALARAASSILLSSEDARKDCERFYPAAKGRTVVVPFAVRLSSPASEAEAKEVVARHGLPNRFFYLPNQFWKHKNHDLVIEAVRILKHNGLEVVVAASGQLSDIRHPRHPAILAEKVKRLGLEAQFRILGLVPRADVPRLMQASLAVINPSLFEGWSTTVEEAKSLAVPLLLSDLPVHHEQAPDNAAYFDPRNVDALAQLMRDAWSRYKPGPRPQQEVEARIRYEKARQLFALHFAEACAQLCGGKAATTIVGEEPFDFQSKQRQDT